MRSVCICLLMFAVCFANAQSTAETTKQTIEQKLGKEPLSSINKDNSFTLYKKEGTSASNGLPVMNYIIVRNDDQRIVEQGSVTMGAVEWSADYEIEISQPQGQVQLERKENSNKRKIDLRHYLARDSRRPN